MLEEKGDRGFLILHGWAGSGAEHWQTWLAERLSAAGEFVRYPVLPDYDAPDLAEWLSVLRQELSALDGFTERAVICHSRQSCYGSLRQDSNNAPGRAPAARRPALPAGLFA
jgi:predicted alpha/beta hydrolase family esterase